MNSNENIIVRILTEWKGKQALKSAQSDLTTFESGAIKLGKTLGGVFAATKVIQFGNASLKAFTADNLAAKQLSLTLANLGLGFDSKRVEDYIQSTEKLTGVLDDQLRPAMQLFLNTTGSVNRAQSMLSTSLNISAATGKDLQSVSTALARAYQGNYTSLQRLGIGVDVATMKTQGFAAVQDQLNSKFAGAAKTAAESYQGSLDKLKVAADNAKEAIGKGMVDAIVALSAGGNIDSAVKGIDRIATSIGHAIGAAGRFIAATKVMLGSGLTIDANDQAKLDKIFGNDVSKNPQTRGAGRLAVDMANQRALAEKKVTDAIKAKAAADKLANDKLLKAKQDQLKLDQASALLKKSQKIFDMQAIEIAAAMQNTSLTADEQLRLQMLSTQDQLAAAIQDKSMAAVKALSDKLTELQSQFDQLSKANIGDPFVAANAGATMLINQLAQIKANGMTNYSAFLLQGFAPSAYDLPTGVAPVDQLAQIAANGMTDYSSFLLNPSNTATQDVTVTVSVDPGLIATVQQGIVNNTASGTPSTFARSQGVYAGGW